MKINKLIFIGLLLIFQIPSLFALDQSAIVAHLTYLASDKLEGRGPATSGIDSAANYIAAHFQKYGLKPGGDENTYFQKMNVKIGVTAGDKNRLKLNGKSYKFDQQYAVTGFSGNGTIFGPIVFTGYGIVAPDIKYDDFGNADFTDKIALIFTGVPEIDDPTQLFHQLDKSMHDDLIRKAIDAKTRGAAGVIFVNSDFLNESNEILPSLRDGYGYHNVGIPVIQITNDAIKDAIGEKQYKMLSENFDSRKRDNKELPASFTAELTVDLNAREAELKNIIGILPGTKDSLSNAPLIIGAHYDHLGYGGPASKAPGVHEIHNGADDNASGVAALLELSARFTQSDERPERPIVFIAFTGEEIGLIGSTYYTRHPIYPLKNVIAMLNLDTVGRMKDNNLIIFGSGTAAQWGHILNGLNHKHRLGLALKPEGSSPSDQAAFFTRNIPVLHFFSGANEDYHKPTDDVDKINFEGLIKITDYVFDVSHYLANRTDALTFTSSSAEKPRHPAAVSTGKQGKRPWLGTVPDFTYQGNDGLKLSGVSAGSPCEKAGLKAGDLITQINDVEIKSIYELNHVLKNHQPGDEIEVIYYRDGEKNTADIVLVER